MLLHCFVKLPRELSESQRKVMDGKIFEGMTEPMLKGRIS